MIGVYVIGEPGAGKSWLVERWIGAGTPDVLEGVPVIWHCAAAVCQLGAPHPTFPGTDRLSMAIQRAAVSLIRQAPAPVLLGEGDRLATRPFLEALREAASASVLVRVDSPPELAASRRAERAGSSPRPSWVLGRRTKVARLAEWWSGAGGALVVWDGLSAPPSFGGVLRAAQP